MKTQTLIVTVVLALLMPLLAPERSLAAGDESRTFLVVVPSATEKESGRTALEAIGALVAGAAVGDRVSVYDGIALRSITDFRIPEARTGAARINKLRAEFSRLRAHLIADHVHDARNLDLVNLPGAYGLAASMKGTTPATLRVLVFASAVPLGPSGTGPMVEPGLVPSDGFVLDSSLNSAFGTADRGNGYLAGVVVSYWVLGPRLADLQRRPLERFYVIHAAGLGAVLHTFADDSAIVIQRALGSGAEPVSSDVIDPADVKKEIRVVAGAAPVPTATLPESARAALQGASSSLPAPTRNVTHVAVVWTSGGDTDLDLYVKPNRAAAEIGFAAEHATPAGRYLRDIQRQSAGQAATWRGDWEGVELQNGDPAILDVWLNTYRSSGAEATGFVRVQHGTAWQLDIPFTMGGAGDKAAGRETRSGNPNWLHVDVKSAMEKLGYR